MDNLIKEIKQSIENEKVEKRIKGLETIDAMYRRWWPNQIITK